MGGRCRSRSISHPTNQKPGILPGVRFAAIIDGAKALRAGINTKSSRILFNGGSEEEFQVLPRNVVPMANGFSAVVHFLTWS